MVRDSPLKPSRKHLREEPYRWECPHCGCTGSYIRKRMKTQRATSAKKYADVETTARDGVAPKFSDAADYYCDGCKTAVDAPVDRTESSCCPQQLDDLLSQDGESPCCPRQLDDLLSQDDES